MAENIIAEIQERLFEMQDVEYQAFQCKLMPTVEPDSVIGVRMPVSYTHLRAHET